VRVFMSYRRTDDANFTGRFHDKLIGVFGDANVFRDIDSIPAGTRFEDVINARLADVDAVLALIGPTWAGRIDASSDFVRMEIAHALQAGTPVIPVLIEDTALPTPDSLPDDLKPMLDRQTVRVRRDPDFHRDAARVVDGVREAVAAQRAREAAVAEREQEERRQAELARRREIEAELARANARAADERRAAEALAAERAQRLSDLARLEEEATQRKLADERARVAEIAESQAARERDADAATARAAELQRVLDGDAPLESVTLPAAAPADEHPIEKIDIPIDDGEETTAPVNARPAVEPPPEGRESEPAVDAARVFTGLRTAASASRAEVGGAVLLVVATVWAIQALFDSKDGSNAFAQDWSTDVTAILLTAALLLPLLAFRVGGPVHAVCAGTSIGYLAYQGLADSTWFADHYDGVYFPNNMVFIAVLLAAAWYMFRRGSQSPPMRVEHPPSRYLQIVAAAATLVTTGLFAKQYYDYENSHRIAFVFFAASLVMLVLSVRRSAEATIALGTLAAESAIAFLAIAIADLDNTRDRALNVAIASAVLTGAALWRTRRAALVNAD